MHLKPKNILFIHQSTDLYGSDKTLLYLVKELDRNLFHPIVVLPDDGPLNSELQKLHIRTITTPVINIHRRIFKIKNMLTLPIQLIRSMKTLRKELRDITIDIVHSNTVVVCLGAIYAKRYGIKHFWHVHEIVNSPKIAAAFFARMVYYFSDRVIFNSHATQKSFVKQKTQLKQKSVVIYNGLDRRENISTNEELSRLRRAHHICENDIVLGLFGRINENKGHLLLLAVFNTLQTTFKNVRLLIIGSPVKGKTKALSDLNRKIIENKLDQKVTVLPFQHAIWKFWDLIDIAVVPSTIPESFGLVALEAMLSKKPVIASNEGGLAEIVLHKETGVLFEMNDAQSLETAIISLLQDKELIAVYGTEGYKRAVAKFKLSAFVENFEKLYHVELHTTIS